jgi:beta-glucanase (GH16 family)
VKHRLIGLLLLLLAIVTVASALSHAGGWTLAWSDEFNYPNGSAPDPAKWSFDLGSHWNNELEYYTDRPKNARIENGNLVITALEETYTGNDGVARDYTSARLTTRAKFEQAYGRFEARIKIPSGQGLWPAFWLVGNDMKKVGWPACGEIDVMETVGKEPSIVHGTIHGPGYSGAQGIASSFRLAGGRFADDYHIYAVEWEPSALRFYVDDILYATRTPTEVPQGTRWVFDHPFYILLNLAVGGAWPGPPDNTTVFPRNMLVDYVRVYKK